MFPFVGQAIKTENSNNSCVTICTDSVLEAEVLHNEKNTLQNLSINNGQRMKFNKPTVLAFVNDSP